MQIYWIFAIIRTGSSCINNSIFYMNETQIKLQTILNQLLTALNKLESSPSSAQFHFDKAVVELNKLMDNKYIAPDKELQEIIDLAKKHMDYYNGFNKEK